MYLKFISYINLGKYPNNQFIIFFSQLLLKNIDEWKHAPVWTPDSIKEATKN